MSRSEESDGRGFPGAGPILGLFALYLLTVLGGVLLANPFEAAGVPTFENPENVANVGIIFVEIMVFTAIFIAIVRFGVGQRLLRALVLGVFGYVTFLAIVGAFPGVEYVGYVGLAAGVIVWLALWVHPEWYVIDAAAVVAGAGIIAQLGNGLGPLPVLIFLAGMALYDAYAVYVSEHMQQIGGGVGELRLPMVYVVPQSLSFSMAEMGNPFAEPEDDGIETREAGETEARETEPRETEAGGMDEARSNADTQETPILLGLGDAIVPGLLAVSGGQFLDAPALIAGTVLNAPALGAILGSIVGLVGLLVLLYFVERAHAGLPVLNACVFLGYFAGALSAGVPISAALGL